MAAMVALRPPDVPSRTPTPPPALSLNTTTSGSPAPIPNKHLPYCSPGPTPFGLPSPPASPPSKQSSLSAQSLLHPPDPNTKVSSNPLVYAINAATVALALEQQANRSLVHPQELFPWLHGLHPQNALQQAFFTSRNPRRTSRRDACRPPPNQRFLTIIKTGGDLTIARIKGALGPEEVLSPLGSGSDLAPCFLDVDPRCGFSVRNFQIQACKIATISDIVVYGDDNTPREDIEKLAQLIAQAQLNYREELNGDLNDPDSPIPAEEFNTFVVTEPFSVFEQHHPSVVAIDAEGMQTTSILDFLTQERIEMNALSTASPIADNVYLGASPEPELCASNTPNQEVLPDEEPEYNILVEASDLASMPDQESLDDVTNFLNEKRRRGERAIAHLEVPSSGSFLVGERGDVCARTLDRLIALCKWIWYSTRANQSISEASSPAKDSDGDTEMAFSIESLSSTLSDVQRPNRILLHCADGYTETTLIALAYYMYCRGVPLSTAIIDLHVKENRNFFTYPTDKQFLALIEPRLLAASPTHSTTPVGSPSPSPTRRNRQPASPRPLWLERMDGSLPSRILPHLYLGNLLHATNPALLRSLGITRILSVGEPVTFAADDPLVDEFSVLKIGGVQDNGVDALRPDFERAISFIDEAESEVAECQSAGRELRGKVLVHCRVGVSRSATIVIASVMKKLGLSFPRAYCYVRARRLNVIVQPHLRFVYELLGWEEELGKRSDDEKEGGWKGRELEWAMIAREIAAMNRPYCRQ